ncbi:MAG: TonB-dependent receptor [Bacteroidales bacterium]|jgi:outer membrane receptor protein involved in Fe transport|nr:TonB-dependent receptor [Bacteroidales bacterium]
MKVLKSLFSHFFLLMLLFVLPYSVKGQQDSIKRRLKEVEVSTAALHPDIQTTGSKQTLELSALQQLPVYQLSDAMKFLSGIVIKDWGGVGGLKTVSVRGFGAQHTGLTYDGIPVTDCQTGQIDLGKFPLNNIQSMSLTMADGEDIFVPARLLSYANVLSLQTKIPVFQPNKPINLQVSMTGGSWWLLNPNLFMSNLLKRTKRGTTLSSSLNINYLYSKGDYPFLIYYTQFGDSIAHARRSNSDIQTLSTEGNLFASFRDSSQLTMKIYYYYSRRGLPGAVIFYREGTGQRLWDDQLFGQVHYRKKVSEKFAFQLTGKYNIAQQRYIDPDPIYNTDNIYRQQEAYLSGAVLYKPHPRVFINWSEDVIYNYMDENILDFARPSRVTLLSSLTVQYKYQRWMAMAGLLHTLSLNYVVKGDAAQNQNHGAPFAQVSYKLLKHHDLFLKLFYKNNIRIPTFNDLYYRMVGNLNLKPEKCHQIDMGIAFQQMFLGKLFFSISGNGYNNWVIDKIVAIPNKNLFIWSMINYGKVQIAGSDLHLIMTYKINKSLKIELTGNYSYQYAIDRTDPQQKSYGNQIPYTPRHSGSVALLFKTPWIDVQYTVIVSGQRYSLPENRIENQLPAYTDHSIALMHDFDCKKVIIGCKAELLNFTNTHYEIIRNYPMQGIGFRVGVQLSMK